MATAIEKPFVKHKGICILAAAFQCIMLWLVKVEHGTVYDVWAVFYWIVNARNARLRFPFAPESQFVIIDLLPIIHIPSRMTEKLAFVTAVIPRDNVCSVPPLGEALYARMDELYKSDYVVHGITPFNCLL